MGETGKNIARVMVIEENPDRGTVQGLLSVIGAGAGALSGLEIGPMADKWVSQTVARTHAPDADELGHAEWIGAGTGMVLGGLAVYAAIRQFARRQLGVAEYDRIKSNQ